jgi:hypothetical protein
MLWILAMMGAMLLLAAALAYALYKDRRLTQADRDDLREAADEVYAEAEDDDGCPVRVNLEKRKRAEAKREDRYRELAGTTR